jgi:uncharacterized protein (TIGR03435 family)
MTRLARILSSWKPLSTTSLLSLAVSVAVVGALGSTPAPQSKASQPFAFEVASIKQNKSGDPDYSRYESGGRYVARLSLRNLIGIAYRFEFDVGHLSGGPDWVNFTRFDVEAKAPAGIVSSGILETSDTDKLDLMLRALLADRFKVKLRFETRGGTVYSLVATKDGPKLSPGKTVADCVTPTAEAATMCHVFLRFSQREIVGQSVDVNDIVRALSTRISAPVEDKTGLKGLYDFSLLWDPGPLGRPTGEEGVRINPNDSDFFTALQDQMGLKLQSRKGRVRYLIIESAQKPS